MAIKRAPSEMISPRIPVDAYCDGRLIASFDSVSDCARAYHVSYQTIKFLLANGKELYCVSESITFDVPEGSPYSYVMGKDAEGREVPKVYDERAGKVIE